MAIAAITVGAILAALPTGAIAAAPRPAYVVVAAATVWTSPGSPRSVDRRALSNPVDLSRWLTALATAGRRGLEGRAQTQVLYAARVLVVSRAAGWSKVIVPGQPTPKDPRGYPGWIPTSQLTFLTGLDRYRSSPVAIVTWRRLWLQTAAGARRLRVSFGTRLTVLGRSGTRVRLLTPTGRDVFAPRQGVALYPSVRSIPKPSGTAIVRTARRFLGLAYLWA